MEYNDVGRGLEKPSWEQWDLSYSNLVSVSALEGRPVKSGAIGLGRECTLLSARGRK